MDFRSLLRNRYVQIGLGVLAVLLAIAVLNLVVGLVFKLVFWLLLAAAAFAVYKYVRGARTVDAQKAAFKQLGSDIANNQHVQQLGTRAKDVADAARRQIKR